MNKSSKITTEESFLGRFYLSIHERAEYLRQKQAANARNDRGEKATTVTQSHKSNRHSPSL